MGVKERLIQYLDIKNISKSEFGRAIGVSNAYVTSIRKSIDNEKIKAIALTYPDISALHLRGISDGMSKRKGKQMCYPFFCRV